MNQRHVDSNPLSDLRFLAVAERLFDAIPDVVFFVKDTKARYVAVNQTLVQRCGLTSKDELLDKTAAEVFPAPMGSRYIAEDRRVLDEAIELKDILELHLYRQSGPGWCLTTKLPVYDESGTLAGIVGVSSDLHMPAASNSGYGELARAIEHIQSHFRDALRLDSLAELCGLSVYQFEKRMKKVFQITAGQFIARTRIDAARRLLEVDDMAIIDVAMECGFSDQSAFTRQFKATTGLTPSEYRAGN